ncbi:MAG: hypothetical protein ABJB11_17270 [Ferruginibacter sp.]
MPATAIKRTSKSEYITSSINTNDAGQLVIEKNSLPKAGPGACTHCSCQKFVKRDVMHKPTPHTGNQPNPCDACGHDYMVHGEKIRVIPE